MASLANDPHYEALSYVWGDKSSDGCRIILDNIEISVRRNLWDALHALRNRTTGRVLWVDALCINQDDLDERGHQVRLMRKVYSQTSRCIAWIIPRISMSSIWLDRDVEACKTFEDISNGFTWLDALDQSWRHETELDGTTSDDVDKDDTRQLEILLRVISSEHIFLILKSVEMIVDDAYWHRLWICQEFLLPAEITIMSGNSQCNWTALQKFFQNSNRLFHLLEVFINWKYTKQERERYESQLKVTRSAISGCRAKNYVELRWESQYDRPGSPLYRSRTEIQWWMLTKLLEKTSLCIAQDPRDKIYGLLGLVDQNLRDNVFVDCSCSLFEVYHNFISTACELYEDLDILQLSETLQVSLQVASHAAKLLGRMSWPPQDLTIIKDKVKIRGFVGRDLACRQQQFLACTAKSYFGIQQTHRAICNGSIVGKHRPSIVKEQLICGFEASQLRLGLTKIGTTYYHQTEYIIVSLNNATLGCRPTCPPFESVRSIGTVTWDKAISLPSTGLMIPLLWTGSNEISLLGSIQDLYLLTAPGKNIKARLDGERLTC